MEQGSLPERYLSRSVIKHIRKQNKNIQVSAAVGNDYSRLDGIITADGMGDTPWIAWAKAYNNFSCSGGSVTGARLTLMLPADVKESKIKQYMADFNSYAETEKIQILGGHSQVSDTFSREQFLVTMVGCEGAYCPKKKRIQPGQELVMVGYAGQMGADVILRKHFEELRTRFSESYLQGAYMDEKAYCVARVAKLLADAEELDILYMHDVSRGGVYGALWQLGVWMDKGFEVQHVDMNIRQETIEICEFYNINPYLLDGTGALLAVCPEGEKVVDTLFSLGITASVIGKVTEKKEKIIVVNDVDRRCLAPVNGDEGYHISSVKTMRR